MGRILDAYKVLVGRSERPSEVAKMRAEFTDLMVDVTSALEKLNAMAARLAKRESRALDRAAEAQSPPDNHQLELPVGTRSPKAHLYQRARARKESQA